MNRRLGTFVLAAGAVGGVAVAVAPQHAWTVGRVLAGAVVLLVGAAILVAAGAVTRVDPALTSLDRPASAVIDPLEPQGLRDARRMLDRPHAPGAVPPEVWRRLRQAARLRLAEAGVDMDEPRDRDPARAMMSEETWRVLAASPSPGTVHQPRRVAAIVHRVLDDLDSTDRQRSSP